MLDNDFIVIMYHPFNESVGGSAKKSTFNKGASEVNKTRNNVMEDDDFDSDSESEEQELKSLDNRDKKAAKEEKKKQRLSREYEDTFDGEDKLVHRLLRIKSKIDISLKMINIEDIITSKFKKISRDDTIVGLAGVVNEWGVVTPIHVLALETEDTYLLLDGLRRVFAAMRSGNTEIPAMVWDFSDKQEGKDMSNIISLMVNRSQRYSAREIWEQMKILEDINDIGPGLIEFLLQMNSGEAMKLKDIMLADMDYAEIQKSLVDGDLAIEGAYKKLCTARKKEDKLAKDDALSIEETEVEGKQRLGIDEVKQLL